MTTLSELIERLGKAIAAALSVPAKNDVIPDDYFWKSYPGAFRNIACVTPFKSEKDDI
jgi:hypothetical protein